MNGSWDKGVHYEARVTSKAISEGTRLYTSLTLRMRVRHRFGSAPYVVEAGFWGRATGGSGDAYRMAPSTVLASAATAEDARDQAIAAMQSALLRGEWVAT